MSNQQKSLHRAHETYAIAEGNRSSHVHWWAPTSPEQTAWGISSCVAL